MSGFDEAAIGEAVQERLRETNWLAMVGLGAGAFVVGLVVTAALIVLVGSSPTGGLRGAAILIGFTFYAANLVRIDLGGAQVDFFAGITETTVPLVVYYAVPMVVLLAAGVVATQLSTRRSVDPIALAFNVVGIAIGYVIVAIIGTFVLVAETVTGGQASPVVADAFLYGFVYPLVFATIGAGLGTAGRYLSTTTRAE
jgi:hypothetical protein